jgi:hypothetical protein
VFFHQHFFRVISRSEFSYEVVLLPVVLNFKVLDRRCCLLFKAGKAIISKTVDFKIFFAGIIFASVKSSLAFANIPE